MRKARLKVIKKNGTKLPFMRGVLAHALVQYGMEFNKAYKVANEVRLRFIKKEEVAEEDIKKAVKEEVIKRYGQSYWDKYEQKKLKKRHIILVQTSNSLQPFSKDLLAKSLTAAGLAPNQAFDFAAQLDDELLQENIEKIEGKELFGLVIEKLRSEYGNEIVQNYHLAIKLDHLDKPVIIYLTGAVGTGKSSLATELASRLGISKITGTDMIRQIMRILLSEEIVPDLYNSTFEVKMNSLNHMNEQDRVISGYTLQSAKVCVGVKAVVERAITENTNIIIEGTHLLPTLIQFNDLKKKAYHIHVILTLENEKMHRSRLNHRGAGNKERKSSKYIKHFKNIRSIHDYIVEVGNQYDYDIVNNEQFDQAVNDILHIVLSNFQKQFKDKE